MINYLYMVMKVPKCKKKKKKKKRKKKRKKKGGEFDDVTL